MAKASKNATSEKTELVDQSGEATKQKKNRIWLIIPALLGLSIGAFFVVRRNIKRGNEL